MEKGMINREEIGISAIKSLFSVIPFAGQPLNELFFDYRGRIRQERLNIFSELLCEYFSRHSPSDFKDLNWVEFSDLFESVILRVARTGSIEKHKRFREIIINYFERSENDIDHTETFLENVSALSEAAILVLKNHYIFDNEFQEMDEKNKKLNAEIRRAEHLRERPPGEKNQEIDLEEITLELSRLKPERQTLEEDMKTLQKYRQAAFNQLKDDDFLYIKQILSSRALLIDPGVGSTGHVPFRYMKITVFGKKFIEYIREANR